MKPILFNGEMIRAILSGEKTQTRRVVKQTDSGYAKEPNGHRRWHLDDPDAVLASPLGQVGDQLYVRETYADAGARLTYRADIDDGAHCVVKKWIPSIHMPKIDSRITLEITGVRIERLQNISDADAEAEGVDFLRQVPDADETLTASQLFMCLWDSIYKNWARNPRVWVYEFKVVPANGDQTP